jgi:predicted CoA-binding protein
MIDSSKFPKAALAASNFADPDTITKILKQSRTIAIVGLSSRPERPSFRVAKYLQSAGYKIFPVNPKETEVLGVKSYATLHGAQEPIDLVQIFRQSSFVPEIVDGAIRMGAKAIWMQEGVVNEAAAAKARDAGLAVVMDRCMLKEHARRAWA